MATEARVTVKTKGLSVFERYLTVWVLLCIAGGMVLGKVAPGVAKTLDGLRSEEHTSELQSHSFISYAVFCLKKKKTKRRTYKSQRKSRIYSAWHICSRCC